MKGSIHVKRPPPNLKEMSGHISHAAQALTQLLLLEGDKNLVINLMLSVFLSALNVFYSF